MFFIIVESPTKANTVQKLLKGGDFIVRSSYGHVRDLPKSELGVDVEHNFEPKYIVPLKARKKVAELKKYLPKAKKVILASDEDREGEAIAWHLTQALGLGKQNPSKISENKGLRNVLVPFERIAFHEITKTAIEEALKNPRGIKIELINAQQARRVLDRLVGYKLSPFLWRKIKYGLSAGRVQSAALRLICEKEKEIEDFISQEYWTISAILEKNNQAFEAQLFKINDKTLDKLEIKNEKEAKEIQTVLQSGALPVSVKIVGISSVSAELGDQFKSGALIAGILASIVVSAIIFIKYRNPILVLPIIFTSLAELVLILGIASIINQNIDLPAIAGIIAAIGTGVDDQIIITDEVLKGDQKKKSRRRAGFKAKIKGAFFIVYASAATLIAAMLPLAYIGFSRGYTGIGILSGFAFTTIIGILVGIFITRPAYAKFIEKFISTD